MPPPVPDEGALGFAWRILSLLHCRDDIHEGEGHSLKCHDMKGGARLPISCLKVCSFSFAIFEFLCPSATCCTNSLISFTSCSLCSAYILISSAVYKTDGAHHCIYAYIHTFQNRGSLLYCGCFFKPHTKVWSCKLLTNLCFCQLSSLLVAFHYARASSGRFVVAYAPLQMSAVNLGQLLLEVLLTHILLPLQVRGKLVPSFH